MEDKKDEISNNKKTDWPLEDRPVEKMVEQLLFLERGIVSIMNKTAFGKRVGKWMGDHEILQGIVLTIGIIVNVLLVAFASYCLFKAGAVRAWRLFSDLMNLMKQLVS